MNSVERAAIQVAAGALAAGMAVTFSSPAAVAADAAPVTAGVTVTPGSAVVGGQVTVVATATNNTSSTVSGALGIENPQYASERITRVSGHACAPRNLQKLIYCGNTQLAPGATMRIILSLTATATGTDNFTIYARTTGSNDTYAYGTLNVS
ncbi:MAG: hypothetical protein JO345_01440 [Streptosporangiaceae bacterium]|nr:hypothetical protein [Streptosporangiaceae bacterium]